MFTIGRLAHASGVSKDSIRFYDRVGLLHPPGRADSGYRLYERSDVERLAFIKHGRTCGLSLETIRQLMQSPDDGDIRSSVAYAAAQREVVDIDRRINALRALRAALCTFLQRCDADDLRLRPVHESTLSKALNGIVSAQC